MEIKTYAPVIIPTLNRFEHFTKCIESLEKCTGAECTDVHIGLDYPPSEKYVEGWRKIDAYLRKKESDNRFKSLIVYRRETNYYFSGKGNAKSIIDELLKTNDRYIVSEDDNVFAPNFLDFINKGLDLYKDDKSVFAICGYRHFYPIKSDDNTFYRQNVDMSVWGYGMWKDQWEQVYSCDYKYYSRYIFKLSTWVKLFKNGNNRVADFLSYALPSWNHVMTDGVYSIYATINDMDLIMPAKVSLVRNIGVDGSGENFKNPSDELSNKHLTQPIATDKTFEYRGTGFEYYDENKKIHRTYSYGKISMLRLIRRFLMCIIRSL